MATPERTLVLLKPDTLLRGLIGTIITRFEAKGFTIAGLKMMRLDHALISEHYSFLKDKPFFPEIVTYMTLGPIVAMVVEGEGIIKAMRQMCGATNPAEAATGTIRGDYASTIRFNLVHASDSEETARVEIPRFFHDAEVLTYKRLGME